MSGLGGGLLRNYQDGNNISERNLKHGPFGEDIRLCLNKYIHLYTKMLRKETLQREAQTDKSLKVLFRN